MMKIKIRWKGIEYGSVEECEITAGADGIAVQSLIKSFIPDKLFTARYQLMLDAEWRVRHFFIELEQKNTKLRYTLEHPHRTQWTLNDELVDEFKDCTDIDLPLTPFTNSLPINRLKLNTGQEAVISVVYFDIMENNIAAKKQMYKRLDRDRYHYQNIPNDFEAVITVDTNGWVTDYPGLFSRLS